MHVECGRAVFGKHSKFSTMRCRKLNFVLIDFKVGLLLTFLASMKAKVRLYQKYVSVLGVYTCRFQGLQFGLRIRKSLFCMCVFIVCV